MPLPLRVARSLLRRPALTHAYGAHPSQVADLHLPRGEGPFPVVVVLHGGFWRTRYGKLVTRPIALDLARRGFAAWNLEYRRVGDGRGGGGGWPETFDDIRAGIDALAGLGDPRLDASGVAVAGHSAGGQLALYAGTGVTDHVAVRRVVALAAVTNLATAGTAARQLMGGAAAQHPDRYDVADPMRRVPLPVPVLLVHPADDATVPVARSREYARAAAAAGAEVQLVEIAHGGHRAPIDPPSDAWDAAARWLEGERDRMGEAGAARRAVRR